MTFKIQIISDLHMEMDRGNLPLYQYDFPVSAPNLALLGDIGWTREPRLFDWLNLQRTRFERVFFLSGNHEPYYSSIDESKKRLKEFELKCEQDTSKGQFILVDRTRYDVSSSLTILGCTLWSKLDPKELDILSWSLNDFRRIENLNPDAFDAIHEADLNWLRESIKTIRDNEVDRRVIVFTHHAPTIEGVSDPKYVGGTTNSAFATELSSDEIVWGRPVVFWAFGHTHWNCDFERNGVRVCSNQRGYRDEAPGYDPARVFEF